MFNFGESGFDPGHYDGANAGPGAYREGNVMLLLANMLRERYRVFSTREDGKNLTLYQRAVDVKAAGCNTLISLHTNAPEAAKGILVIYSVLHPEDKAMAEYIGLELSKATGIPFRAAKTRSFAKDPHTDYYGMIRYPIRQGIEHPFIVEHGSHWEMAIDTENKLRNIVECYGRILDLKEVEPLKYQKIRRYGSYVHLVEMDPATYRLDITEGILGKLEKLSSMYGEPKLNEVTWVRMNAQFFGGRPQGYGSFIDPTDKLPDKPSQPGYTDMTYIDGRLCIGTGGDFTIGTSYSIIHNGATEFKNASWFPAIMAARNPRSMAGSLKNGSNVFIVVDGRWPIFSLGMTAQQQAAFGHELSCEELTNFDGGGSSQIMIGDKILNRPSDNKERSVISAIVGYRKYTLAELPVLRKGKIGVYVNLLQRLLDIDADGIFGNGTLATVKLYQSKHGLVVDGIVGKQTWASLTNMKG